MTYVLVVLALLANGELSNKAELVSNETACLETARLLDNAFNASNETQEHMILCLPLNG